MRRLTVLPVAAVLALSTGCTNDAPTDPAPYTGPVNVSVQAATATFAYCGEEIPVTVTVTDPRNNRPVAGFLVNFNVLEGGGSMFGGAALTGRDGVARDIWTIGRGPDLLNTMAVRSVDASTGAGVTHHTLSYATLSKIAFSRAVDGLQHIYLMNADGSNPTRLTSSAAWDDSPTWSPDGSKIAFVRRGFFGGPSILVMNADGSDLRTLTSTIEGRYLTPAWSPDGGKIAFSHEHEDERSIYVMNADGSNPTALTNTEYVTDRAPTWSPDGSKIAFSRHGFFGSNISVMNADGSNLKVLISSMFEESYHTPAWSPDGNKIAIELIGFFGSSISVMNADGSDLRTLISSAEGRYRTPSWSPDGSRILFESDGDGHKAIYVMNSDGTGVRRLTHSGANDSPAWSGCIVP